MIRTIDKLDLYSKILGVTGDGDFDGWNRSACPTPAPLLFFGPCPTLTFPGHPRAPAHGILWRHAGPTPPITCLSGHPPTNYPPRLFPAAKAALTPRPPTAPSFLSPSILAVRMANLGWTTRACIAARGAGSLIRACGVEM